MYRGTKNYFVIDSPINAMAVDRNGLHLAVAGRSFLKVFSLADKEGTFGQEEFNLRSSSLKNLNFSNNDVAWCPLDDGKLATAATNGAVVVWNVQHASKAKNQIVFNDHKRTVNRVSFHNSDPHLLLSGSHDGCIKLFDIRERFVKNTFVSNSESVRDVKFSPAVYSIYHFASAQDTGNIEIWDIRKPDKPECNFLAHDGPVLACEWHPNDSFRWLATGGRDKTIKIWDLSNRMKPTMIYQIHSIAPVSKLKWRPDKDFHIGSCSLVVDFNVYVWDIKRSYVPYAIFGTRKQITKPDDTCGFAWKNDPHEFVTASKSGTVYQHCFDTDAYYPAEKYRSVAIDLNPGGDVSFALSEFIQRYSHQSSAVRTAAEYHTTAPSSTITASTPRTSKTPSLNSATLASSSSGFISTSAQPGQQLSTSLTQATTSWDTPLSSSMAEVKNKFMGLSSQYFSAHPTPLSQTSNSTSTIIPSSSMTHFNTCSPILYRTTPEEIVTQHFRCKTSQLITFANKEMGTPNNEMLEEHLSMKLFIDFACSYVLSDQSFEQLCEVNAAKCEEYGRPQVAQSWRTIRHMFCVVGRHPTSSGGGPGNNPSGGSLQNTLDINSSKIETSGRHPSGGGRHLSGQNAQNLSTAALNANSSLLKEDSTEDDDIFDRGRYYRSITQHTMTNKFSVDFFDLPPSVDSGNSVGSKVNDLAGDMYDDWELQRESIMHRHKIEENEIPLNQFNEANDTGSPANLEEEDDFPADDAASTANVQALLSAKNVSWPVPTFSLLVADMLRQYVDSGDIQTAVSIILVLGDRMKTVSSIDRSKIIVWCRTYIEMLQRFQLWNVSSRLLKLSPDSEIQAINQTSTTVSLMCAKCRRLIKAGSVCDKCQLEPFTCTICHVAVRGLYMWCHGCAHGGHSKHMREWFRENTECPSGCGHKCELF